VIRTILEIGTQVRIKDWGPLSNMLGIIADLDKRRYDHKAHVFIKEALQSYWIPLKNLEVVTVTTPKTMSDNVNHPKHYTGHPSGIECIDVIEHMTLNLGNAVKYIWRAGLKTSSPTIEDLKKAIWYIEREIKRLEKLGKVD
jgi:hypothetical protein